MKYSNGNVAIGVVKDGLKSGVWTMICDGQEFQTEYVNGQSEIWRSKAGFSGNFNRGLKSGLWVFQPRYGFQFAAYYEDDLKNGPYTEIRLKECWQCLFEAGNQISDFKCLGTCDFINNEREQGLSCHGVKVGHWRLYGEAFYDKQQNKLANYE